MDFSSPFVFVPAYLVGVYLLVGFALFVLVDAGALATAYRGLRADCRVDGLAFWPWGFVTVVLVALWALVTWLVFWPRFLRGA